MRYSGFEEQQNDDCLVGVWRSAASLDYAGCPAGQGPLPRKRTPFACGPRVMGAATFASTAGVPRRRTWTGA